MKKSGKIYRWMPAAFFAVGLLSCVSRPSGVLSESKMIDIMADLETAEAFIQTQSGYRNDRFREGAIAEILEKRGVTREQFDSTMSWYSRDIDLYYPLYEKVEKELVRRGKADGGINIADMSENELWAYSKVIMISPKSDRDVLRFSFPVDLEKGERLLWKARSRVPADFSALLGVEYDNGSYGYITRTISSGRRISIDLQTDSAYKVSRVFGNIAVDNSSDLPLWLDSISLSSAPIDTLKYHDIFRQRTTRRPTRRLPVKQVAEDSLNSVKS